MVSVYGTLGPSCAHSAILAEMLRLGMTGVRLNLSHGSLMESAPAVAALREAERQTGVKAELLIDMQGPELRIGALRAPLMLPEGGEIDLTALPLPGVVSAALAPGSELLLDDGKLLLRCLDGSRAAVIRGGTLESRKSVAVSGLSVTAPPLTDLDRENLRHAAAMGVTGVMQPFVRSAEDLRQVRRAMAEAGCAHLRLFAKIEDASGVAMLPQLLPAADEIVIARGDLGNAMPLWQLPAAQKRIAAACRAAGKPFMVVTQMLQSMTHSPVPTRAEVSDVFNAVLDGAASVMVTGETAVGEYPTQVIRYLAATAAEASHYLSHL
ncbi:MAG: pyruvate kinase [Oscillospiraceae bacterium]|nr:pyruvate kinase [Oscillospiraceae bacterium]